MCTVVLSACLYVRGCPSPLQLDLQATKLPWVLGTEPIGRASSAFNCFAILQSQLVLLKEFLHVGIEWTGY